MLKPPVSFDEFALVLLRVEKDCHNFDGSFQILLPTRMRFCHVRTFLLALTFDAELLVEELYGRGPLL
jgi:hypothetical protein